MKELNDDVPNLLINGAIALSRIAATRRYSSEFVSIGVINALQSFLEDNSQGELGSDENDFIMESLKAIADIASDPSSRKSSWNCDWNHHSCVPSTHEKSSITRSSLASTLCPRL